MKIISMGRWGFVYRLPHSKVGRKIGSDIYFHKRYINCFSFSGEVKERAKHLPDDHEYTVIRFNFKDRSATFIYSPEFDDAFFPTIETAYRVEAAKGEAKLHSKLSGKFRILHHRWSLVKNTYKGFDVEEDFKFSKLWSKTPGVKPKNYKTLNHWLDITLKKVFRFYRVRSIRELILQN